MKASSSIFQGVFLPLLVVAGCSATGATDEPESALGIATFQIVDSADALTIVGLGGNDEEIGRVALTIGTFDFAAEQRGSVYGRQLAVAVHGRQSSHESEGVGDLTLPLDRRHPAIVAFLLEPAVSNALARHGITFEATEADAGVGELTLADEAPYAPLCQHYYSGTSYLGAVTHNGCSTTSNAKFAVDATVIGEYRCCTTGNFAERRCRVTGGGGQSTPCGTTGPQGCAVCWIEVPDVSCLANQLNGQGHAKLCFGY